MNFTKLRKYIFLSTLLIFVFSITGCGSNPKNFTTGKITITLTDDFHEEELSYFDAYYESEKVLFSAVEETNEELELSGYEIASLNDYCSQIAELNGVAIDSIAKRGDYYYFTNKATVSGANYTYVHCMFKSGSSYWVCEFVCKSKDYDKLEDSIFKWADSIVISK